MARRRRISSYSNSLSLRRRRDFFSIASAMALPSSPIIYSKRGTRSNQNKLVIARLLGEDRRFWHPAGLSRPALNMRGAVAAVTARPSSAARNSFKFSFAVPDQTIVCVRRKLRTEVLHAKRKTGKRTSFPRRRRRNYASSISC